MAGLRHFGWLMIAALLCIRASSPVCAGQMSFVKDYVYQASEVDSKASSRAIALEQLKRLLLEQAATLQERTRKAAEQAAALARMETRYTQSAASLERNNLFELATTLRDAGDLEEALKRFDQLVKEDPRNKRAYLGRAATYFRMDKTSLAFKDIDRALEQGLSCIKSGEKRRGMDEANVQRI